MDIGIFIEESPYVELEQAKHIINVYQDHESWFRGTDDEYVKILETVDQIIDMIETRSLNYDYVVAKTYLPKLAEIRNSMEYTLNSIYHAEELEQFREAEEANLQKEYDDECDRERQFQLECSDIETESDSEWDLESEFELDLEPESDSDWDCDSVSISNSDSE